MDSGRLYRYCQVQFEEIERTYSYLADDTLVWAGDWVEVPFGKGDNPRKGRVISIQICTAADAPWPPERTKVILRKAPCPPQAEEGEAHRK